MAFQFWLFLLSTHQQMTLNAGVFAALFHIFACLFLDILEISNGVQSDIDCLKSIKHSLKDPYGYLNTSWNFNNDIEVFICKFTGVECWHPDENKVLNLRLSDMGLSDQFPRGIRNCTSLTGLDLSSNKLSGPLPFDIEWLVPFDRNHLTGEIPPELGHLVHMKQFNVANNMLSGVVPYFGPNVSITADSFVTT